MKEETKHLRKLFFDDEKIDKYAKGTARKIIKKLKENGFILHKKDWKGSYKIFKKVN